MTDLTQSLLILSLSWLAYFLIHSLLASQQIKSLFHTYRPQWQHGYRVLYNTVAVVLLLPIAWFMYRYPGEVLWQWHTGMKWLANALAILAIGMIIWTTRYYDGMDFMGIRQFRSKIKHDDSAFCLSPAHRFVRHPWYSLILVIMWTRDMDTSHLLSYGLITLYFVIGSRLEERKLVKLYGDVYRQYLLRVPGLIPNPWRYLSTNDTKRLLSESATNNSPGL